MVQKYSDSNNGTSNLFSICINIHPQIIWICGGARGVMDIVDPSSNAEQGCLHSNGVNNTQLFSL